MTLKISHDSGLYRLVLETLSTSIMILDQDLNIQYLNPASEDMLACSEQRMLGVHAGKLFDQELGVLEELRQALENNHPYSRREVQLTLPGGDKILVDYTVNPLLIERESMALMEIVQLERLLRISRDQSLSHTHQATRTLIKGVAHEVKNPLGGIRGAAQLLARELNKPELKDYIDVIISEVDRLRNLVDRMLGPWELSRMSLCNIHQILERVLSVVQVENQAKDKRKIRIEKDYDLSLPEFEGDHDRLIQAFLNIVGNAMQALSENPNQRDPEIKIKTRVFRQLTINGKRHRLAICTTIEDNGPGIPEELRETIFLPMVSGRPNGTGLGLSLAQSIINQHSGLIECDSQPHETVFNIFLPLDE